MIYVLVCGVAFLASGLTFFSGFGLGTLLLPAFAAFFAVELAVALTAVVHFLNGTFKLFLVWRHIQWAVTWRFGLPALVGSFAGAWSLLWLSDAAPLLTYSLFGYPLEVTLVKLIIGTALLFFGSAELLPSFRRFSFPARFLPLGGLLSGYFGGLAGMQGALRAAFLVKSGLTKEAYVATSSATVFLIDVSRLTVYSGLMLKQHDQFDYGLLAAAIICAFLGATLGNHLLPKATVGGIQTTVAIMLLIVALGLISGFL